MTINTLHELSLLGKRKGIELNYKADGTIANTLKSELQKVLGRKVEFRTIDTDAASVEWIKDDDFIYKILPDGSRVTISDVNASLVFTSTDTVRDHKTSNHIQFDSINDAKNSIDKMLVAELSAADKETILKKGLPYLQADQAAIKRTIFVKDVFRDIDKRRIKDMKLGSSHSVYTTKPFKVIRDSSGQFYLEDINDYTLRPATPAVDADNVIEMIEANSDPLMLGLDKEYVSAKENIHKLNDAKVEVERGNLLGLIDVSKYEDELYRLSARYLSTRSVVEFESVVKRSLEDIRKDEPRNRTQAEQLYLASEDLAFRSFYSNVDNAFFVPLERIGLPSHIELGTRTSFPSATEHEFHHAIEAQLDLENNVPFEQKRRLHDFILEKSRSPKKRTEYFADKEAETLRAAVGAWIHAPQHRQQLAQTAPDFARIMTNAMQGNVMVQYFIDTYKSETMDAYKHILKEGKISKDMFDKQVAVKAAVELRELNVGETVFILSGERTSIGSVLKDGLLFAEVVDEATGEILVLSRSVIEPFSDYRFRTEAEIDTLKARPLKDREINLLIPEIESQVLEYFQSDIGPAPKGATSYMNDGRAILWLFEKADVSTVIHEMHHIWFNGLPIEQQKAYLKNAMALQTTPRGLGYKDWKNKYYPNTPDYLASREYAARQFERYAAGARTKAPFLTERRKGQKESIAKSIRNRMRRIYGTLENSPIDVQVKKDTVEFFDSWFMLEGTLKVEAEKRWQKLIRDKESKREDSTDTPETTAKAEYLKKTEEELRTEGMHRGEISGEVIPRAKGKKAPTIQAPKNTVKAIVEKVETEKTPVSHHFDVVDLGADTGVVVSIIGDLQDLGHKVDVEFAEDASTIDIVVHPKQPPQQFQTLYQSDPITTQDKASDSKVQQVVNRLAQIFDVSYDLTKTASGRESLYKADNVYSYERTKIGEFALRIQKAYRRLSKKDLKWLKGVDERGISNFRMIVEGEAKAPNEATQKLAELVWEIQENLGKEAVEYGMMRKVEGGYKEPFEVSETGKLPRFMNPRAHDAVFQGTGAFYDAIVEAIRELNPELGQKEINRRLRDWRTQPHIRKVGMIEEVRHIPKMPDRVMVDGKLRAVLETDPLLILQQNVQLQARRIGMAKEFGQGALKTTGTTLVKKIGKLFGLKTDYIRVERIKNKLKKAGIPFKAGAKRAELLKLAKEAEVDVRYTREEVAERIRNFPPELVNKDMLKRLQDVAKKLGGMPKEFIFTEDGKRVQEASAEFLYNFAERIEQIVEYDYERLRKQFVKEGGSAEHFDRALNVLQGIPIREVGRNPITRWGSFLSKMIGVAQTSRAFIPNMLQPASLVPAYTGTQRLLDATASYFTNKKALVEELSVLGIVPISTVQRTMDRSVLSRDLGNILQGIGVRASLLKWATDRNNIIAGEAFRLMADDWKAGGIPESDLVVARELRLSQAEIAAVQRGEMSDATYNKIGQVGVQITQFMSEAPHRKGLAELDPLIRELFPYQNYGIGTMKSTLRMFSRIHQGWMSGDWVGALQASKTLLSTMGRYALVGMGVKELRNLLVPRKPRPEEKEKEFWENALSGMLEVQFLGPVQRGFSLHPSVTDPDKLATMLSPKLRAALSGVAVVINAVEHIRGNPGSIGKYAEFPAPEQAFKVVQQNFGQLDSLIRWHHNFAYPFSEDYFDVRRELYGYERKQITEKIESASSDEERNKLRRDLERARISIDIPIALDYNRVFRAIQLTGDPQEVMEARQAYYDKKSKEGVSAEEARSKLRASLQARSPLRAKEEVVSGFLRSLSPNNTFSLWILLLLQKEPLFLLSQERAFIHCLT